MPVGMTGFIAVKDSGEDTVHVVAYEKYELKHNDE
jgi:hypothetical protein